MSITEENSNAIQFLNSYAFNRYEARRLKKKLGRQILYKPKKRHGHFGVCKTFGHKFSSIIEKTRTLSNIYLFRFVRDVLKTLIV